MGMKNLKEVTIIKRDGRDQNFSPMKLKRVAEWACEGNSSMASELIKDTSVKVNDRCRIQTLVTSMIETASNKISLIHPQWEFVAGKLLLLDTYKVSYPKVNIRDGEYPHIKKVFSHEIYDDSFISNYNEDEIEVIQSYIKPERDLIFNYRGLYFMLNKYCKKSSKYRWRELPQHTYMRVAMFLMRDEENDKVLKVKELYDALSNHEMTLATPVMLNSGRSKSQMASCVLTKINDNISSIMDGISDVAQYSKYNGGIAVDVTDIRASGSTIKGNNGVSSGPVPFIKMIESTIRSVSQGGTRVGACVITFDWWHKDVMDMIMLKRNDGTEDSRARHLKYSIRINDYFMKAVEEDRELKLVNPQHSPKLVNLWGKEWDDEYKKSQSSGTIKARDLMYEILKTRLDTGNLYIFFTDNVNRQNRIKDRFINSSNLCCEILQPSRSGEIDNVEISSKLGSNEFIETIEKTPSEISLCTLGSIDISKFSYMSPDEKSKLIRIINRALDNTFELAFYPVESARIAAQRYRYIGIGVYNYAHMLASNSLKYSDKKSLIFVDKVFKDLKNEIDKSTDELSKERGVYPEWREDHGSPRRNALTMAIAPTATSGKVINSTESTEPIHDFMWREDSTITIPAVVKDFKKYNKYYEKAFDIPPKVLIDHAAARQKYIDQGQSINMYLSGEYTTNARKLFDLHKYSLDSGVKTLYYVKTKKSGAQDICESCT